MGILQRDDRRDGQALSGRAALKPLAIGLGAIRALSRLLPDGDAGGLAGDEARLQRRDHHRSADDAVGGFWFIPATHIAPFWAFLLGVCIIAAGLTFLETIANPYTTVLGPPQYAATRINLAQSTNGIGLLFGPIAGGAFFYSKNAAG